MTRAVPPEGPASPDAAVVAELERVELAARERRLTAQAEADRILAEAEAAVAAIDAGLEARIQAELTALRATWLARADAEVARIDAALALPVDDPAAPGAPTDPGFEAAVERLVGAVLAEPAE